MQALAPMHGGALTVLDHQRHATTGGRDDAWAAFVELLPASGAPVHGAAVDADAVTASLKAVFSAINRLAALPAATAASGARPHAAAR